MGREIAQPDNNNTLSSAFKTFFEREKLTGDNFNDWYRSLRIVLGVAGTYDYLFKPCPDEPPKDAAEDIKAAWKAEYKIHYVACLMLGRMSPALQRQFELYFQQAMLDELRRMFEKPQAVEIYDLVDSLHNCKQAIGKSVSAHVLKMKGYMDQLQALGKPYDNDMAINLINRSLNKDFGDFVRNFNMHCVGKTVSDLHALLIDYEKGLKDKAPTPQVLAIQKGMVNKLKPQANKKGKGKGKADKNMQRKCPLYLKELRTNKNKKAEHGAAALGSIMYACSDCTRPDCAVCSNLVSRCFSTESGNLLLGCCKTYSEVSERIREICFKCMEGNQTNTETLMLLGAVDWKSKKQTTIAMSATQAEYMAASEAAMEAVWIRKFVGDLGVMPSIKKPIDMYCDNSVQLFRNDSWSYGKAPDIFYGDITTTKPRLRKGFVRVSNDRSTSYMFDVEETFGRLTLYLDHLDMNLLEYLSQAITYDMDDLVSKKIGPPKKRYCNNFSVDEMVDWAEMEVETNGVEARTSTTDGVEARNSTTEGVKARTSTKDKGKEKVSKDASDVVETRKCTIEVDIETEYESDDDSDYQSDKSVDYFSPGEDELIELKNRMKANKKAKAKAKDKPDE
ncbi:hypothetical protein Tco_0469015 [Tanacetum coccineum]